jgi:cobalt-zinc-cadmium efflux system outer membrane protein
MKKYLIPIVIVACVWFKTGIVKADDGKAALDSLIQIAIDRNPDILAQKDAYQSARYTEKAQGWLPDPQVSAALSNVPYNTLALDETPMSGIALGVSQMIPWPGKLANQKAVSGLNAVARQYSVKSYQNRVTRLLKSAYFNYSYFLFAAKIIDENITLLEALVDVAQTKYANGEGLAQDVLKAQTELSKMHDRKLEIVKMQRQALSNINMLLDQSPFMQDSLPAYLPDIPGDTVQMETLSGTAIEKNPSLAISLTQVEIAEKRKALAKSDYWPNLMLGFEYRIRERMEMDPVNGRDFISAKIGLSLPLWFWHNQNNRLDAAASQLQAQKYSYDSSRRNLEYQISDATWELDRLTQGYALYDQTIISQAQSALESANIAYQVGKVDFLNLLEAQRRLFELQLEKLKILRDYNKNYALLEELVGAKLERN